MTQIKKTTTIQTIPTTTLAEAQEIAQEVVDRIRHEGFLGFNTHPAYRNFKNPTSDREYVKVLKEIRRHPGQTRRGVCMNAFTNENDSGLWSQMLNAGLIQYTKTNNLPYQYTITQSGEEILKKVAKQEA